MPETTSAINACDATIALDNAAGVLTDISGTARRVTMAFSQEIGKYRTFSGAWVRRLACARDATFQVDVVYSTSSTEALQLLRVWYGSGGSRTLRVRVPNGDSGSDEYSAEVLIATLRIPLDADEASPVAVTVELLPDGAVTFSTV